jgi:hypothetical protein
VFEMPSKKGYKKKKRKSPYLLSDEFWHDASKQTAYIMKAKDLSGVVKRMYGLE